MNDELMFKIMKTQKVITELYYTKDNLALSFSGGKDSTVLKHIIDQMGYNIKSVFCNTGLEYPEIINFVKEFDNVIWVKPKYTYKYISEKYGYPVISKEQSRYIWDVRNSKSEKLINQRLNQKGNFHISKKWLYLLETDLKISDKCCYHLKKAPMKKLNYYYMTGERTQESNLRKQRYHNCIMLNKAIPLRIWSDKDVNDYINEFDVKISDIYKTENRTGCFACLYGCHLEKGNNRFQRMKINNYKLWKFCMIYLGLKEVLEILNVPYE